MLVSAMYMTMKLDLYHHLNIVLMLTCIDHFTLWPEVFLISDITAEAMTTAFGFLALEFPSQLPLTEDCSLSPLYGSNSLSC